MRRRSRTRRVLKWVGTAFTLLTLIIAVGDLSWSVHWVVSRRICISVSAGYLVITEDREGGFEQARGVRRAYEHWGDALDAWFRGPCLPGWHDVGRFYAVWVPFWILSAACVVPTAFLWWRDRRPPAGHCQRCGYDLTGNVSGRCPECGQPVAGVCVDYREG